jgi:hypothetical protein
MAIPAFRVFFDTSVYIAGLLSPAGAAAELIRLAETGAVAMVVSEEVIVESDEVLGAKFPDLVEDSRRLWKSLDPEIAPSPNRRQLAPFCRMLPAADAAILCAAAGTEVSAFVTWNTRDFMKKGVDTLVPFPIVIPKDCLKLFREWIEPYLD